MLVNVHLFFIITTLLAVVFADEQAFMWVLGKKETLPESVLRLLHYVVALGLACIMVSGGLMYARAPMAFWSNGVFIVKMSAILALIINTYFIGKCSAVAVSRPFASLTSSERVPLFISGAVSAAGWLTALTCGLLL